MRFDDIHLPPHRYNTEQERISKERRQALHGKPVTKPVMPLVAGGWWPESKESAEADRTAAMDRAASRAAKTPAPDEGGGSPVAPPWGTCVALPPPWLASNHRSLQNPAQPRAPAVRPCCPLKCAWGVVAAVAAAAVASTAPGASRRWAARR